MQPPNRFLVTDEKKKKKKNGQSKGVKINPKEDDIPFVAS